MYAAEKELLVSQSPLMFTAIPSLLSLKTYVDLTSKQPRINIIKKEDGFKSSEKFKLTKTKERSKTL